MGQYLVLQAQESVSALEDPYFTGNGRYAYLNGIYEGEWQAGKPHGQGIRINT